MELNSKNLEVLSAVTKMDKEQLFNAITKTDAPELKLDLYVETNENYNTFINNLKNQEYYRGKLVGEEEPLRKAKQKAAEKYGINTDGIKSHWELIELIDKQNAEKFKTAFEGEKDTKVKEMLTQIEKEKKEKEDLRSLLTSTEQKYTSELDQLKNSQKESLINNDLLRIAQTIPFQIPTSITSQEEKAKYVQTETLKYLTLLKTVYQFDYDNNSLIVKKGGEVVKNRLLQPEKLENVALEFAKEMNFNLASTKPFTPGTTQTTANFGGISIDNFNQIMAEKGIKTGSREYLVYLSEFKKQNK